MAKAKRSRRVFVGFWTDPHTKRAIRDRAERRRQSMSSFLDEVVVNVVAAMNGGARNGGADR